MAIALTTPITGAAMTGFTSPTYTHVADTAPDSNGKQYAVTNVGGTQTGVTAHSVSSPFTITFTKPKAAKPLGQVNPITGQIRDIPINKYGILVRKGVTPAANQQPRIATFRGVVQVPAGAETYDKNNVLAMLSAAIGSLSQQSVGLGDTVANNVF